MTEEIHCNLAQILGKVDTDKLNIIPWGSPIPYFGDLSKSEIATIGLNPSNKEFVDSLSMELQGNSRRFHTLSSLGINEWTDVSREQVKLISNTCDNYFHLNPYDSWFGALERLIVKTGYSYYNSLFDTACHLDLVPFATQKKWAELTISQRNSLFEISAGNLANMLLNSPVRIIILNGKTVVDTFEAMSNTTLTKKEMPNWTLPRKNGKGVKGYSYNGTISQISNIKLGRTIFVLGFNHNIQSSFGVTTSVKESIANWISNSCKGIL